MISGLRRGLALAAILALGLGLTTQAGEKHIVIPEVVDAIDLNTGQPYYAPPVPGGHYTKDTYGHIAGTVHGALAQAKGLIKSLCSLCGGTGQCAGCGNAAGTNGLGACGACGGKGFTLTDPNAHAGHNHGAAGAGVPVIAANGAGNGGSGHGLLSGLHGNGNGAGNGAYAAGNVAYGAGNAGAYGAPVAPAPVSYSGSYGGNGRASAQAAPSGQAGTSPLAACANGGCGGSACGDPACHGLFGRKGGRGGAGAGCGTPGCTNPGCGMGGLFAGNGNGGAGFGHGGGNGFGGAGCGNPGCTSCGNGAGMGNGAGFGHGGGYGNGAGHPAGACGNPGCDICGAAKGMLSKLHGLLASPFAKHHGPKWFMGPGGPVPLTPGYVPYVNPVRSPRDFFAFPPYLDQAMEPGYGSMPKSTAGFATDRATTPTDFVVPAAKPVVPPPAPRTEATRAVPPPAPRTEATAPMGAEKEDN